MGKREDIYDTEIAPLMTKIIEVCNREEIPMLATFQYTDPDAEEAGYCTTNIPGTGRGDSLSRLVQTWFRERNGLRGHVALAETHVTNPDGSKTISIRRV
jgi:hypothetical protein